MNIRNGDTKIPPLKPASNVRGVRDGHVKSYPSPNLVTVWRVWLLYGISPAYVEVTKICWCWSPPPLKLRGHGWPWKHASSLDTLGLLCRIWCSRLDGTGIRMGRVYPELGHRKRHGWIGYIVIHSGSLWYRYRDNRHIYRDKKFNYPTCL